MAPEDQVGIYSAADFSSLEVKNSFTGLPSKQIAISFMPCHENDLTQVECAEPEVYEKFTQEYSMVVFGAQHFIDFEQVDIEEDPRESQMEILLWHKINEKPFQLVKELVEYQTELNDNTFNFMGMTEPRKISYLNFDANQNSIELSTQYSTILLSLSSKVVKQKRIVYDIFMLFGDIGGVKDFLFFNSSFVFGIFSKKLMEASLVTNLFLGSTVTHQNRKRRGSMND